jgi:hypothetical protein
MRHSKGWAGLEFVQHYRWPGIAQKLLELYQNIEGDK